MSSDSPIDDLIKKHEEERQRILSSEWVVGAQDRGLGRYSYAAMLKDGTVALETGIDPVFATHVVHSHNAGLLSIAASFASHEIIDEFNRRHSDIGKDTLFILNLRQGGLSSEHIAVVLTAMGEVCQRCWNAPTICHCSKKE